MQRLRLAAAPLVPLLLVLGVVLAGLSGCDRRVEPFDPDEKPEQPDLSRIFPPEAADSVGAPGTQGTPPGLPPAPGGGPPAAATASRDEPVRGTVRVVESLADRAEGGVLFIVARSPGGGPPLAVKRIESPSFPLAFELGPGDRMIASRPFVGPLLLSARLDADGNATSRQPGDLEGAARAPVDPGASDVDIVLDQLL